jgi:hypothetical protein
VLERIYWFKKQSAKGFKSSKGRVAVFCCCANMKGEKRDVLLIGEKK